MNSFSLLRVEPRCFGPGNQRQIPLTDLRSSLTSFMTELRIVGQLGTLGLKRHPSSSEMKWMVGG
jgi:hypothetical protein